MDVQKYQVWLNVYDVTATGNENVSAMVVKINNLGRDLGLGGVFHGAVQIDQFEWSFGFCEQGTGVYVVEARKNPIYHYRESVDLGYSPLSKQQIKQLLRQMKQQWPGASYELLSRNCCHFCEALAEGLGVRPLPAWVNRLAVSADATAAFTNQAVAVAHNVGNTLSRTANHSYSWLKDSMAKLLHHPPSQPPSHSAPHFQSHSHGAHLPSPSQPMSNNRISAHAGTVDSPSGSAGPTSRRKGAKGPLAPDPGEAFPPGPLAMGLLQGRLGPSPRPHHLTTSLDGTLPVTTFPAASHPTTLAPSTCLPPSCGPEPPWASPFSAQMAGDSQHPALQPFSHNYLASNTAQVPAQGGDPFVIPAQGLGEGMLGSPAASLPAFQPLPPERLSRAMPPGLQPWQPLQQPCPAPYTAASTGPTSHLAAWEAAQPLPPLSPQSPLPKQDPLHPPFPPPALPSSPNPPPACPAPSSPPTHSSPLSSLKRSAASHPHAADPITLLAQAAASPHVHPPPAIVSGSPRAPASSAVTSTQADAAGDGQVRVQGSPWPPHPRLRTNTVLGLLTTTTTTNHLQQQQQQSGEALALPDEAIPTVASLGSPHSSTSSAKHKSRSSKARALLARLTHSVWDNGPGLGTRSKSSGQIMRMAAPGVDSLAAATTTPAAAAAAVAAAAEGCLESELARSGPRHSRTRSHTAALLKLIGRGGTPSVVDSSHPATLLHHHYHHQQQVKGSAEGGSIGRARTAKATLLATAPSAPGAAAGRGHGHGRPPVPAVGSMAWAGQAAAAGSAGAPRLVRASGMRVRTGSLDGSYACIPNFSRQACTDILGNPVEPCLDRNSDDPNSYRASRHNPFEDSEDEGGGEPGRQSGLQHVHQWRTWEEAGGACGPTPSFTKLPNMARMAYLPPEWGQPDVQAGVGCGVEVGGGGGGGEKGVVRSSSSQGVGLGREATMSCSPGTSSLLSRVSYFLDDGMGPARSEMVGAVGAAAKPGPTAGQGVLG